MKKNKISLALIALFVTLLFASMTFAASDNILSQNIKEADGTSGQNTNSGSGVKTDHIQDGAVTNAKITGPLSASKISSTGLNADTVDGMHATDLAPVMHTHNQADVNGLTSALAGKADVNHNHDTVYQKKYGRVAVVAVSGGDYTDPVSALVDIGAWCPVRSAENHCLLKIMPGLYDLGLNNGIGMQQYVDIEGSGEDTTKIRGSIGLPGYYGLIEGASNTSLRHLTVENVSSTGDPNAILCRNIASMRIENVSAFSSGTGDARNSAIYVLQSVDIALENVKAVAASGWQNVGVNSVTSNTSLTSVTAQGYGGTLNFGISCSSAGSLHADHSVITGGYNSIEAACPAYVAYSKLNTPILVYSTVKCIGVYNDTYDAISCQ